MTRVRIFEGPYDGLRGDQDASGAVTFDPPVVKTPDPANVWPEMTVKPARATQDFLDSLGVNVHISNFSTSYGRFDLVEAALSALGITRLRDGACAGCTTTHPRQQQLSTDLGARWTWIAGDPRNTTGTIDANLGRIASTFAGVTDAIEHPNEWDAHSSAWAAELVSYGRSLAAARDAQMPGTPLVAPSFTKTPSRQALVNAGWNPAWADRGNMHSYFGAVQPDTGGLASEISLAAVVEPGKASWATETGSHNAIKQKTRPGMSERASGIYAPRIFLDYFWRGVERTFLYQLMDPYDEPNLVNPEYHFGLFRADGTAKPAATSIRSMIDRVGGGRPASLGGIAYSVSSSVTTRDMLLQRADGSYVLCLWRTTAAWDPNTNLTDASGAVTSYGRDISTGSKVSTVTFGQPVTANGVPAPRQLPVTLGADCVAFVEISA